jgi:amidohydrolase
LNSNHERLAQDMKQWRHTLHAHPEFGFEELRTARFVAAKLSELGITDIVEGIGGTGIVANLRRGTGARAIALRADMDALRITEQGEHVHRSQTDGVMHACGHDGHTAMLLGAAKLLMDQGGFDGTIRLIFQPAEEWGRGASAMLDDGLLSRFPFAEIYGLHNLPGLPVGHFETCEGALMSAEDVFEIDIVGVGGHASQPDRGREVMVAACSIVTDLQTIVSRRIKPTDTAVVSITELLSDGARNVLPGKACIRGDARSFRPEVSALIEQEMRLIADGIARAYGCRAEVRYRREFIALINHAAPTAFAVTAARSVFGDAAVVADREPITASEDFARFLTVVPGCFAFIGNGATSPPLHNPTYDFDDRALIYGARYLAAIAQQRLAVAS